MLPRLLLLTSIALAPAATVVQAQPVQDQLKTSGQVTYVSGGVGEDSAERIQALNKDFNLKLLFALKDGHYIADVAVAISDMHGGKMLDAVSEGPWFLAKLARGKYQITAAYAGKSFTRETKIATTGQRELIFRWESND